jgi:hypothetical protein
MAPGWVTSELLFVSTISTETGLFTPATLASQYIPTTTLGGFFSQLSKQAEQQASGEAIDPNI